MLTTPLAAGTSNPPKAQLGAHASWAGPLIAALLLAGLGARARLVAAPTGCAASGYCYVTPTGAGAENGADWANAYADLPSGLTRGVRYFLAGSASAYGPHKFNDADSGTAPIYIYKAVDCGVVATAPYCNGQSDAVPSANQPQSVPGWQASFGALQAEWFGGLGATPGTVLTQVLRVCTDYLVIDGATGTTDPANGGPSGFGFLVYGPSSPGLYASNNSCGSTGTVNNLTLKHVELKGVRLLSVPVLGCALVSGNTYSITTGDPPWGSVWPSNAWGNGDRVAGFTAASALVFRYASDGTIVQNANGNTFRTTTNGANACANLYSVSVDASRNHIMNASAAGGATFSGWDVENNYIHDSGGDFFLAQQFSNATISRNYWAHNSSTPSQHASGIGIGATTNPSNNVTFSYNWMEDVQGTAFISQVNSASFGQLAQGWFIYGNVFFYTSSEATAANSASGVVRCLNGTVCQGWQIFNNTIYNFANAVANVTCGDSGHDCGASSMFVYDNLYVNDYNSAPYVPPGGTICHDETAACALTAQIVQDYNYYDANDTGPRPGDVHIASSAVNPASFFVNAASANFNLRSHTANLLNTSAMLPANSRDANGNTRGAGRSWDAGAFQFSGPAPPTSLGVTTIH